MPKSNFHLTQPLLLFFSIALLLNCSPEKDIYYPTEAETDRLIKEGSIPVFTCLRIEQVDSSSAEISAFSEKPTLWNEWFVTISNGNTHHDTVFSFDTTDWTTLGKIKLVPNTKYFVTGYPLDEQQDTSGWAFYGESFVPSQPEISVSKDSITLGIDSFSTFYQLYFVIYTNGNHGYSTGGTFSPWPKDFYYLNTILGNASSIWWKLPAVTNELNWKIAIPNLNDFDSILTFSQSYNYIGSFEKYRSDSADNLFYPFFISHPKKDSLVAGNLRGSCKGPFIISNKSTRRIR